VTVAGVDSPRRDASVAESLEDTQSGEFVIAPSGGLWHDIRADHRAVCASEDKYGTRDRSHSSWLLIDAVRKIGFQMMVAYRVMRAFRAVRLTPVSMLISRLIRHMYGAEIHWDAELAPGVVLVHGTALVLSREARVGSGCILFQSVTLGMSIDAVTRRIGGPTLAEDVHVGPGAALLGPISVGRGSKIMANAVVMTDVPANSVVQVTPPVIRSRGSGKPE
jgi:serine O-acetyltransferase